MEPGSLALEAVGGLTAWLALGLWLARGDFSNHGFHRRHAGRQGLTGMILGLFAMGMSIVIWSFAGKPGQGWTLRPSQPGPGPAILAALVLVAVAQEVICRGWLLTRLAKRVGTPAAITLTSLGFAGLHLAVPGVTGLSLLDMFVFGLALAIWAIRTGALWGPISFHAVWNVGLAVLAGDGPGGFEGNLPTLWALLGVLGLQAWLWARDKTSR